MTPNRRQVLAGAAASAAVLATARQNGALAALSDESYASMSAGEAIGEIRAGRTSVADYVDSLLARSDRLSHLNAFITQDKAVIRAAAAAVDAKLAAGQDAGALSGVPFCAKDNIDSADMRTTGGTPGLADWRPSANAPILQSLLDQDGVLIGKANMHELAFGITNNNAGFGAAHNPYDAALIPGGSSGGTGVAVAAGLAPAGLGSDTGGSVRIPAALCGCVGFRPTLNRWSQSGVIPISHTRDTVGPIARSVDDCILFDSICAADSHQSRDVSLAGTRIGVPRGFFYENLDPQLAAVVDAGLGQLSDAGAALVEVDIANIVDLNNAVSFPIALYEVLRELSAYLYQHGSKMSVAELVDQVAGPGEKGILGSQLGEGAIPAHVYRDSLVVGRPRLISAYQSYFADNDLAAMVVPTTPLPARPIGQDETVELNGEQVPTFFSYIRNTDVASNAGVPCLTVPAGLTADGLPVGIEFVGATGDDATVLGIGKAYEAARGPMPGPNL